MNAYKQTSFIFLNLPSFFCRFTCLKAHWIIDPVFLNLVFNFEDCWNRSVPQVASVCLRTTHHSIADDQRALFPANPAGRPAFWGNGRGGCIWGSSALTGNRHRAGRGPGRTAKPSVAIHRRCAVESAIP